MSKTISLILIAAACLAGICTSVRAQQLKLGLSPTQINRAAVLELQSWNQGLLLTRVDTGNVNAVIGTMDPLQQDSADGLIIYQVKDSSIYYRAGGYWHKLVQASQVGIVSLNGDSTKDQHLEVISTDPTHTAPAFIDNNSGGHSLFLPDASESTKGLVNTGAQTFKGDKTINSGISGSSGLSFTHLTSSSGSADPTAAAIGVNSNGEVVKVPGIRKASGSITGTFVFPLLNLQSLYRQSKNISVSGVDVGDVVLVTVKSGLLDGMWLSNPRVESTDTITIDVFQSSDILGSVLGRSYSYTLNLDIIIIR